MSIQDRDYILRMIRHMIDALERALGRDRSGPDDARRAIDEAAQNIFGPLYRTLRDVDAQTAAALVSDPEKRWALATLFVAEGKLLEEQADIRGARGRFRVAAEILLDLAASPQGLTEHARETLRGLEGRFDPTRLNAERARALELNGGREAAT